MSPLSFGNQNVKEPNVSGAFYTDNAKALSAQVEKFVQDASVSPRGGHVDIVIVPHAGYNYSGAVAGFGYKAVTQNQYKTIVIIAPSHFFPFNGVSIWKEGGFKTPLGTVAVDSDFAKALIDKDEQFYFNPDVFEQEHALEVQLPFLQKIYQDIEIVPVIMGQPSFQTVDRLAQSLIELIGDRKDVLLVISTDMSHYHDDAFARKMDFLTLETIKSLDVKRFWANCQLRIMEMCGYVPVTTALLYAQKRGLTNVEVLRYANSGDVSGDRDRVVGYSAIVISGKSDEKSDLGLADVPTLTLAQKRRLIEIARQTIEEYIRTGKAPKFREDDPRLLQEEGAFVTIHKKEALRGCIGNIVGRGPLYETVKNMAIAAATQDPRFPALESSELKDIDVEVSVLSKPQVVKDVNQIVMGKHGVIVSRGDHHGVYLPQVADETGWTREQFLSSLCSSKAGLSPDAWKDPKTTLKIFSAAVFSQKDVE
jgi:hypothetical protein